MNDYVDFYIGYKGHPRFKDFRLVEDDIIRVIIQKWEMIIFTNNGEVLGDYDFGGNLLTLLHQTKVSASFVRKKLIIQIENYIPEITNIGYKLEVNFVQDKTDFRELMFVNLTIAEYDVYAEIGKRY